MEVFLQPCVHQNSQTVDSHDGVFRTSEEGKQVENGSGSRVSEPLQKVGGPQVDGQTGASDHQAESRSVSHDFDDDDSNSQHELSSFRDGEPSVLEPKWLQEDESSALWVKWRGKWQAGIRCARADWPLSTLRAKPTHDRKQYFVVFFPNTRNYSWADMLLVRSIGENPEPIAYRTHKIGLESVKDLSIARRFIMQKLAVGMLNIVDQFHNEALVEPARSVVVWKEFAMEASRCTGYSDLGSMLLKLQNMILQKYMKGDWLSSSFQLWAQQCQDACSAESVELLREELYDSILWNQVSSLWDAPVQPTLGSEWKTWKHEVMKWFSTSDPSPNGGETKEKHSDSPSSMELQVSQKRPKLIVHRAELVASQAEPSNPPQTMTLDIESEFFSNRESTNTAGPLLTGISKEDDNQKIANTPEESAPLSVPDRWNEIAVESGSSLLSKTPPTGITSKSTADPGTGRNRQCSAFIESKGRQCVRWANDGDVYCCVHLPSRFTGSSTKAEASPFLHKVMCEGTTVLGSRCKHGSLPGSSFCKKHGPKTATATSVSNSPQTSLKRKHQDVFVSTAKTPQDREMVLFKEAEAPLQVQPLSFVECDARNESFGKEVLHCVGSDPMDRDTPCHEAPKRYSLYCENHIPGWLKCARNGKSRIISKEVFVDLLKSCRSKEQKLHLHAACELFYELFKSILSLRNPVPMEVQIQRALAEASKDFRVGEFLLKLVCTEKERLRRIWGLGAGEEDTHVSSSFVEESSVLPMPIDDDDDEQSIRCKICFDKFTNEQELGSHWMDNHKKEAQWLFRGHACAICLDSFTNKKGLETHVQDRHHVQFVEQCMLLLCIPCKSHFGNAEQLWSHVLSAHQVDFRAAQSHPKDRINHTIEQDNGTSVVDVSNSNPTGVGKFICRSCGLEFDLLPDLDRHHQAAHIGPSLSTSKPQKKGIWHYSYRLKSGRLTRPRFKKGVAAAADRIRNRANNTTKKRIQATKALSTMELNVHQPHITESTALGKLAESDCQAVAKILFSEIQKTKPRPNNLEILATARAACCRVSLKASLEGKYGILPEKFYLKAAKLCSEHSVQVEWHHERFICPRGCKSFKDPDLLSPVQNGFSKGKVSNHCLNRVECEWVVDECHCVIDLDDIMERPKRKKVILCKDISFGKECISVACVVDEALLNSIRDSPDVQDVRVLRPWESFTYLTAALYHESCHPEFKSSQLGCSCPSSTCCPETCAHVDLFDEDYDDARDIYGAPMNGRFPYDDKGRIMLEEGYLVYECNRFCSCSKSCPNRVLQNGVRVRLEVFKTENKGWAVRAGEPILRGTFVCEYIGEVIDEDEANKRRIRYGKEGCSYMYTIDAQSNDMSRMIEGEVPYVIDSTKYGNVSRFINHRYENLFTKLFLTSTNSFIRVNSGSFDVDSKINELCEILGLEM